MVFILCDDSTRCASVTIQLIIITKICLDLFEYLSVSKGEKRHKKNEKLCYFTIHHHNYYCCAQLQTGLQNSYIQRGKKKILLKCTDGNNSKSREKET